MIPCERHDTRLIDAALQLLGTGRFALAIHDSSFPATAEEDIGRGRPCSQGGLGFLRFARSLGFNTVQLEPQGKTAPDCPEHPGLRQFSLARPLVFNARWHWPWRPEPEPSDRTPIRWPNNYNVATQTLGDMCHPGRLCTAE
jgi:hypothetical protein